MAAEELAVSMDDKELFAAATAPDEPVQDESPAEQAAPVEDKQQPRDESGRFAPKTELPAEAQASIEQNKTVEGEPKDEGGQVPSWRLRELREQREAAENRARDFEQRFAATQYQLQQMQRALQEAQPKAPPPDVFENPNGFLEHGVQRAINPVQNEIAQMREFYSRKEAIREYGQDKVQEAYQVLGSAMKMGDPNARALYAHAMSSMDPFGVVMDWHTQRTVASTIGKDPNAWFEKTFEERLAKDEAFRAKTLERLRGAASAVTPSGKPAINLPPSLNKVTGGVGNTGTDPDENDPSDRAIFKYAAAPMRRSR